jgi:hypothetical protein
LVASALCERCACSVMAASACSPLAGKTGPADSLATTRLAAAVSWGS